MSNRLHVAKSYKIEYADKTAFNWKVEEFHNLLSTFDVSYVGDALDTEFEADLDEYVAMIDELTHYDNCAEERKNEIDDAIRDLVRDYYQEYDFNMYKARKGVLQDLKDFLASADTDSGVLYFAFF